MRALTFETPRSLRLASVPDPELLEPTDALVRVRLSAICGSDLHVYRGHEAGLDRGTVMGHEFMGEVLAVGSAVRSLRPGARVVSPFSTSCGACWFCRAGLPSRCERGQLFGWVQEGRGLHGGQAEQVRVPLADSTLVEIAPGLSDELALLAGDVLSTGLHAAENGGAGPDTCVCVLGCGPVGLAAVLGARQLGATRVFAVDALPERLELAERFGARPLRLGAEDVAARLRAATEGRGADVVLEVVGSAEASRLAYELVRVGGTLSVPGVHNESTFAFSPGALYDKNLTYRSGRAPARAYMQRVLAWLEQTDAELELLISHRLPLADGVRAYDVFERKLERCTKVLLRP